MHANRAEWGGYSDARLEELHRDHLQKSVDLFLSSPCDSTSVPLPVHSHRTRSDMAASSPLGVDLPPHLGDDECPIHSSTTASFIFGTPPPPPARPTSLVSHRA